MEALNFGKHTVGETQLDITSDIASGHHGLSFGKFFLDLERRQLVCNGGLVPLRPKSFDVLLYLAERQGQLVSRDQLLKTIWAGTVVTGGSITQCLVDIRRALGDENRLLVRTVPRLGLIFEMPVEMCEHRGQAECAGPERIFKVWSAPKPWMLVALLLLLGMAAWLLVKKGADDLAPSWSVADAVVPDSTTVLPLQQAETISPDPEAQALFLRARHITKYRWNSETLPEVRAMVLRALDIDPDYVAAWNLLASVYADQISQEQIPAQEGWRLVEDAAIRAHTLAPLGGVSLTYLAESAMSQGRDLARATRFYADALALEPENMDVLLGIGKFHYVAGQAKRAIDLLETLPPRNPLCSECYYLLAHAYMQDHQLENAKVAIEKFMELSPGGHYTLAEILVLQGKPDEALREVQVAMGSEWDSTYMLALVSQEIGDSDTFTQTMAKLQSDWPGGASIRIAQLYARAGNIDAAFDWLQRACKIATPSCAIRLRSPLFENLHADPRWQQLLASMGVSVVQIASIKF